MGFAGMVTCSVGGSVERKLEGEHVEPFGFLPVAEMTAGIHAPKQCLKQECSRAKCHATVYGIRH